MSHTKEPWKIADHDKSIVICFQGKKTAHGTTPYFAGGGALESERNANARRIVACVNACKGIDIGALESDGFPMKLAGILALKNERDELLARLDVVCEVQIVSGTYNRIRAEREFAVDDLEYDLFSAGWKAAIASVKGVQSHGQPEKKPETSAPAIVFFPAGSLGEEVES